MLKVILISMAFGLCLTILQPQSVAHPPYVYQTTHVDFVVRSTDPILMHHVAVKVEAMRDAIVKKWLPEPIPRGFRRIFIRVEHSSYNKAFCRRTPNPEIIIYFKDDLDHILRHELTHAILCMRYPDLPKWTHEGVASTYDGAGHQANYVRILAWCRRAENYPLLLEIMRGVNFNAQNTTAYTASNSLVKFLLHRDSRYTLFLYSTGRCTLERAYGYSSIRQLKDAWIDWLNAPAQAIKPLISARKPQE